MFWNGAADPTRKDNRLIDIPERLAVKHLLRWAHRDEKTEKFVWPFQKHKYWCFWAFNRITRREILQQTNHFLEKQRDYDDITVGELAELLNKKDKGVVRFMHRVCKHIRGSASWFYKEGQKLRSAMQQLGCVTFFITYSFADYYDPSLHALFGSKTSNRKEKMENVRDYPGIVALYWQIKMNLWRKFYYGKILKTDWWWGRSEFQDRGSAHAHDLATSKRDPGLVALTKIVWEGECVKNEIKKRKTEEMTTAEREKIVNAAIAKKRIQVFVDKIIKAMNHSPDFDKTMDQMRSQQVKYEPHPSEVRICDLSQEQCQNHYHRLLMTVQQHECKPAPKGCLRKKNNKEEPKCRFHFPKDPLDRTDIEFEKVNGVVKARIKVKTNNRYLNPAEKCQIMGHSANVDMQILLDFHVAVNYAAKYSAKGEKTSHDVQETLQELQKFANFSDPGHRAWRKLMIKFGQKRNYSAQEVMFHSLGIPLVQCPNLQFQDVNLYCTVSCWVDEKTQMWKTSKTLVDVYAERMMYQAEFPTVDLKNMNLNTFIKTFKVMHLSKKHSTLKRRKIEKDKHLIINWIPEIKAKRKEPKFALWCEYELLKYKPWDTHRKNVFNVKDKPNTLSNEQIVQFYDEWIAEHVSRDTLPDAAQTAYILNNVEIEKEDQIIEADCEFKDDEDGIFEFIMQSNDPEEPVTIEENVHISNYDWRHHSKKYSIEVIKSLQTWLEAQKKVHDIPPQIKVIDIEGYKSKQRKAYNIVKHHFQSKRRKQLRLIIMGKPGTGKSHVIHGLRQLLGLKCKILAPTGNTAFSIGGSTTCSQLWLPVAGHRKGELTPQMLEMYQKKWPKIIEYVIIDEISMVGQEEFCYIDQRLRQITGNKEMAFGGLHMIIVGDFAQLPPVGDTALWRVPDSKTTAKKHWGHFLYQSFNEAVILTDIIRQKDPVFIKMLESARNAQWSKQQWKHLQRYWPHNFDSNKQTKHQDTFPRLLGKNRTCTNYNLKRLQKLQEPIAKIRSINHPKTAKEATTKKARGLTHTLYLARGATIKLTENLWTEAGLYNGASGKIHDIIFAPDAAPPALPAIVLAHFPNFKGPDLSILGKTLKKIVPIVPFRGDFELSGRNAWRLQIPMKLAWGFTIHSSQGATLEGAWINLEDAEISSGMTYVALSRLKTLKHLMIEPHEFGRLQLCRRKGIYERIQEEKRLSELEKKVQPQDTKTLSNRRIIKDIVGVDDVLHEVEEIDVVEEHEETLSNWTDSYKNEDKTEKLLNEEKTEVDEEAIDVLMKDLESTLDLDVD